MSPRRRAGHNDAGRLVYLDSNVWNLLVDAPGVRLHANDLVAAFHAGRIQVVSSLAVEEELLGTARRRPRKYDELRKLHTKLAARRSLLPLNERHVAEVARGGKLGLNERYNAKARQDAVRKQARARSQVLLVADDVWRLKEKALQSQLAAASAVRERLSVGSGHVAIVDEWFGQRDVADWVSDIIDEGVQSGRSDAIDPIVPSLERVPSAWLLAEYSMARIKRTLGDNRKAQDSDRYDGEHCAAGAYYDVLVTADKEFTATLALIPDLPFEVVTPNDFATWLSTTDTPPSGADVE